ncbi:endoglucanase E-4 isoform X1 [Patella vulgata]|uniref:endoglucanase E-4 isoform X1 n=1 Tax=Patella vulgata TaxID=6465 RepID=UPI0021804B07|nr:endoglucanase E-4 isoform X1 [Patella vulgata]
MDGWIVNIRFDQDVNSLNVWSGILESQNGKRDFVIKDIDYNTVVAAGSQVCPGFQGFTNYNLLPTATITFIPNLGTKNVNPVSETTTAASTTTTTVTPTTTTTVSATIATTTTVATTAVTENIVTDDTTDNVFDYDSVLEKSILFFEAQRSGALPSDNRIPYRNDSALDDVGTNGEDLTGGWYDAGDFVKFNLPMASATTMLIWGLERFGDAYMAAEELDNMYKSIKWPLDYFLKCWNPDAQEYYYQVGDPEADHNYWGRPEDMTIYRPAYKLTTSVKGSDVAGETAAALAAGSIVFQLEDAAYSQTLLTEAISLYTYAKTYTGIYPLTDFYKSSGYRDELCVAAVWLYKATGDNNYLTEAKSYFDNFVPWAQSWDEKAPACQLMLFEITQEAVYKNAIIDFFSSWMSGDVPYTTCGLAFRDEWGSLRYAANTAFLALLAADDGINPNQYREWAISQINYILGDNKLNMSYVIGYSNSYPLRPHHASSSCPLEGTCDWSNFHSSDPNPQILYGALVGGPDINDSYVDDRTRYEFSEVACDYNAGLQSAIAGIVSLHESGSLPAVALRDC